MNPIRRIRRIAGVLAGLACAWLGLAIAAPAALAAMGDPPPHSFPPGSRLHAPAIFLPGQPFLPPGWNKHPPLPPRAHQPGHALVRTVVVGGMPGWQIAMIAAGAAVLAATVAVLAYRVWTIRRQPVIAAPEPTVPDADVLSVP